MSKTHNNIPRALTFAEYKALRYARVWAQHSQLPESVSQIKHEADRIRSGRVESYAAEKEALGLDFDYTDTVKPYGGYVSDLTLDADEVTALGFDPEHLTAKVIAAYAWNEWYDDAETQARDCGFEVEKSSGGEYRYEWHHENGDRPEHHSVKVDYSGPRDRSNYRWITVPRSQESAWLSGNAWAGMSKSVRAQVRQEVLRAAAKATGDHMIARASDDVRTYHVEVTLYWRGEEIASDSLGGIEIDESYAGSMRHQYELADAVLDNGLIDNALDGAVAWANKAVLDAQQRASKIVADIALLPERSIAAVRDTFTTAKVIRKTA